MSTAIFHDPTFDDDRRRQELYAGNIVLYSQRPAVAAMVEFTRALIVEAFAPLDPLTAQYEMTAEKNAELLGVLKPKFIHHETSKRLLRQMLAELGCDPEQTYFDVPRLRSSTSDGYLTTGIAYAWHPHRDTWYSAPPCQLNWWFPIYDIAPDNCMAFHPRYFAERVENDSAGYNYYEWNRVHRGQHVAQLTKQDARPLPRPTQPLEREPELRVIVPVGGIMLFSGGQMHSSVPNTSGRTRFSVDFRTVHAGDAVAFRGAPNVDSHCTGTTMRDYLRTTDLSPLPDTIVAAYDDGTAARGQVVYRPDAG
jgi:hypothetical protein